MPKKLVVCIFALLVVGCAPTPEQTESQPRTQTPSPEQSEADTKSAEQWLAAAAQAQQVHEQQRAFIYAAEAYLNEEQWHHAGAILTQLDMRRMQPALAYRYRLQRARFYAALKQWQLATDQLDGLAEQLTQRSDRATALELGAHIQHELQNHLTSARLLMSLQQYNNSQDYSQLIFERLALVDSEYWRNPDPEANQTSRGWVQLMTYLTRALDGDNSITRAMSVWRRNFPDHPATRMSEQLEAEADSRHSGSPVIAVLLPEQGPLAAQGKAVRDGILAALSQGSDSHRLHFFNSANADFDDLTARLHELQPDYVIGPLDRDAVNTLIQYPDRPWVQLWLNQTTEQRHVNDRDTFFALDLASETEFASEWLAKRGYRHALIAGPNTSRGRELTEIFSRNWEQHNPQGTVRSTLYSSATEMQDAIRDALHVSMSESRKDRVEQSLGARELHHELRNRQDIDVVYLLGDASQARLVKPFVDVSLSAFSNRIPVYANSSVHQQRNQVGTSDLSGIRFSEAPWVLPGHPHSSLRQQLAELNSGWGTSLQRLAAMGHDSIDIIDRIQWMKQLPGYSVAGFTGRLRISDTKLVRELDWAIFDQQQIRREWSASVKENIE